MFVYFAMVHWKLLVFLGVLLIFSIISLKLNLSVEDELDNMYSMTDEFSDRIVNTTSLISSTRNCRVVVDNKTKNECEKGDFVNVYGVKDCVIPGGECVKEKDVNCQENYVGHPKCSLKGLRDDCFKELVNYDCRTGSTNQYWFYSSWVGWSRDSGGGWYERQTTGLLTCKKVPSIFVNHICGFCEDNNRGPIEWETNYFNCEKACVERKPDLLCDVYEKIIYHFVRVKYYVVKQIRFNTMSVTGDCSEDDKNCINEFFSRHDERQLYYLKENPSKSMEEIPHPYHWMKILMIILLIINSILFIGILLSEIYNHNGNRISNRIQEAKYNDYGAIPG